MMRILLSVLLVLAAVPDAEAQEVWGGLGGSAGVGGISLTPDVPSVEPSIAISPAGTVYVTWAEWDVAGHDVRVAKWNGTLGAWVEFGLELDVPATNSITPRAVIRVGAAEKPVVAWVGGGGLFGGHVYLKRWSGTEWEELGGSATGNGVSIDASPLDTSPSLALDVAGNPVVAWQGQVNMSSHVYVRRWNGSSWTDWDGSATVPIDGGLTGSFQPSLALDGEGRPWVSFLGNPTFLFLTGNLHVRTFDDVGWHDVGPGAVAGSQFGLQRPVLAIDATGAPVVCWTQAGKDEAGEDFRFVVVNRWDGESWTGLIDNPAVGATSTETWPTPAMAITPWNETIVAWLGDGGVVYVKTLKPGAAAWTAIGESYGQGGISGDDVIPTQSPTLAVGDSGLLAAAWSDTFAGASGEIMLKRTMVSSVPMVWNLQQAKGEAKEAMLTAETVGLGTVVQLGGILVPGIEASGALQVEVRALGTAFTGVPTHTGATLAAPIGSMLPVSAFESGGYHWQARVKTASGLLSSWVAYGGNAESAADFTISTVPVAPPSADDGTAGDAGDGNKDCGASATGSAALAALLAVAVVLRR